MPSPGRGPPSALHVSAVLSDFPLNFFFFACTIQFNIWEARSHQVFQAAFRCRSSSVSSVREACDEVSLPRERKISSLTRSHRCLLTGKNIAPNEVNRYTPTETTTTQKRTYRKGPNAVSIPDRLPFLLESLLHSI